MQDTPVILLTARAGQDAAVEGLLAGADDYIAKPFPARELVARVGGQIALARVRREGERKRAEQERAAALDRLTDLLAERSAALSDSREKFHALAEGSAHIVWTADARGTVTEDSPSWRAFTGQTLDEWLELGWINGVHPDDRADAQQQWQRAVDGEAPGSTRFRLWHAPSQTWRYTRLRAVPLYHDDGTVRGWIGMNTDLTEQPDR